MSAFQEQSPNQPENTYVIDAESAAEMARLMRQDQLMTAGMGGIFPEQIDLSGVQRVLDLACGPGGWPPLKNGAISTTKAWPICTRRISARPGPC